VKSKNQIQQSSKKTDITRLREAGETVETGMTTMLRMLSTRIVLEEPIWTVERYADVTFSKRRSYLTNLAERCGEAIRRHPAIKSFGAVGGGMSLGWIRSRILAEKDFGNVIIADPKGELIAESPGAKRDKE